MSHSISNYQALLNLEIANMFSEIVTENENYTSKSKFSNYFEGSSTPSISIHDYIERLTKYFKSSPSTLIIALIYIDRICEMKDFKLTYKNFHRLFLVALVIAVKYNEDIYYQNKYYAERGGMKFKKLNYLENLFLINIKYTLYIRSEDYLKYSIYLKNLIEERIGNLEDSSNTNLYDQALNTII